ncbi:MAG: glycosyltransferase family 4 protein [Rhodospirillales bacterium]
MPGDLASRTGGYAYARALLQAMPETAWRLHHLPLPDGFPEPDGAALRLTAEAFARQPSDRPLLVDGLAYGCLPPALLQAHAGRWLALVHHPLALENGLSAARAAALRDSETQALAAAEGVVVTSPETARVLAADFGVPARAITVAEPGTIRPAEPAKGGGAVPRLLCVGTVSPRKGQDVLVEALSRLRGLAWHCRLIGSTDRAPETTRQLREAIVAAGLEARVELAGEVAPEAMEGCYAEADIFVLPSRYEGYGMAFAEALAHGLPVVACPTGAVPQTVPAAAALFVPPDDPRALAEALTRLLRDRALRQEKAAAAWDWGRRLPQWSDTARRVAAALDRMAP